MGKKLFALGAVAVMVAVALATACVVDDGDSCGAEGITVEAGGTVTLEWANYEDDADGVDMVAEHELEISSIFGWIYTIEQSDMRFSGTTVEIPIPEDAANGAYTYTQAIVATWDGTVGDILEQTFTVTGEKGTSVSNCYSGKIQQSGSFIGPDSIGNRTVYVEQGCGMDLTLLTRPENNCSVTVTAGSGLTVSPDSTGYYTSVKGTVDKTCDVTMVYKGNTYTFTLVAVGSYIHTIHYNADGGSGTMADSAITDSSASTAVPLTECTFTRPGYTFSGWLYNGTIYQKGQAIPVGDTAITVTAQWSENKIIVNPVAKQYAVSGSSVSFTASGATVPVGGSVSYSASGVPSGLSVGVNGDRITCASSTAGTYTFTLNGIASGYSNGSTKVTVEFAPVLAFTNTPAAGAINA